MANAIVYIKDRKDKAKIIKDAIFAFSGGQKQICIKGEGQEISTAVEIAEILKNRLYPGIEITKIHLGSRPFINYRQRGNYNRKRNNDYQNNKMISNIEILLKTKSYI